MRRFLFVAVVISLLGIAHSTETTMENHGQELRDKVESLTASLKNLELKMAKLTPADSLLQNDLEERVQALESQMGNVHEDINAIGGEISVINTEQDLQDTQIQQTENDINEIQGGLEVNTGTVAELTAVTDDLQVSVLSLQETNATLVENIDELSVELNSASDAISSLDSRVSQGELNGAVAFHAYLGPYSTVRRNRNTVIIFPRVLVNLGSGYNSKTGVFTVPSGGGGLYYFYAHFTYDRGQYAIIGIRKNGGILCNAFEDDDIHSRDEDASSCGAVSMLQEGDTIIFFPFLIIFMFFMYLHKKYTVIFSSTYSKVS